MYPRIFANMIRCSQPFLKSSCALNNCNLLNRNRSIFVMCLPQTRTVERHRNRRFHKRRSQPRTKLFIVSSGFLYSLFGIGEEKDDTEELKMTIKRSILLIQKGEYQKAEQMLHVALRQAQTLQHDDGITYVYDVLANLAYTVEDYKKAKKLFVTVMQRLISKGVAKNDLAMIHVSLKVASIYEKIGNPHEAELGYKYCIKELDTHLSANQEDKDVLQLLGLSLEWYASMLFSQSRYTEALDHFIRAYAISVQINGIDHEQTVVLLNDLGTVHCMNKEYDQAIEHLSKAIEIGEKLPDMDDIGSIHVNLGNIFIEKGLYEEAKKHCIKGQKLAKAKKQDEYMMDANECLEKIKNLTF